jgi:hypothetical protein
MLFFYGQVTIGLYYGGFTSSQSMASLEFYLKSLSTSDVALAMNRSHTLVYNPNCQVGNN